MIKKQTQTSNPFLIPLLIVGVLFFMLGFSLGINGLLIPFLKKAFSLSNAESYLVLTATFSAFVVFGYPSGLLIQKIGYKRGIVVSFILFALGLYLFIPSAKFESFLLFLLASFISGTGNTVLQAAINPYITILGPIESAAKRMCLMTIFNRSGWAVAPIFLAIFLDIAQINVQLTDLILPFYIVVGIFVLLGAFTWFAPLPEIKAVGEDEADNSAESANIKAFVDTKKSIWRFPHLLLGVVALFFYVGLDTLTLISPVDFAQTLGLTHPERYTLYSVIGISAGCVLGVILIPHYMSQLNGLRIGGILALFIAFFIPLLPATIAIYLIPLIGFSTCLVWGAVWPLAISYLGKYTKTGSSLLVTAIVGGAILPLIFGYLKDILGDIHQAYWLFPISILFIVFYAFKGYQIGIKGVHTIGK